MVLKTTCFDLSRSSSGTFRDVMRFGLCSVLNTMAVCLLACYYQHRCEMNSIASKMCCQKGRCIWIRLSLRVKNHLAITRSL
jgi:hypothetical protein